MIKKWVEYIKESLDFEKLSHTEEDVYKYTLELLEDEIDNIFVDVHQEFKTSSGDITPYQTMELEKITKSLARLITIQVCNNIELKNLKADNIDLDELSRLDDERDYIKEGDEVITVYDQGSVKDIFKFKVINISELWGGDIPILGYMTKNSQELIKKHKRGSFKIEDAELVVKVDTYNDFVFPEKRL